MTLHTPRQLTIARNRKDLKYNLNSILVYRNQLSNEYPLDMAKSFKNLLKQKKFFDSEGFVNLDYWNKVSSYIQDVFGYKHERMDYQETDLEPQFVLTPEQHLLEILLERQDRITKAENINEYIMLCYRCGERSSNGLCYCTQCHWGIMESLAYYENEVKRLKAEMDEVCPLHY